MEYSSFIEKLVKEGLIIPVDKPLGWTSFDVVNKIRISLKYNFGITGIKAGHAGTLDPLATGLLLVCLGKATRQVTSLQEMKKTYTGKIKLGETTPSFDAETAVSQVKDTAHITYQMALDAAKKLTGNLMQEPPLYSAVKTDGKRAYKRARNNEVIELPKKAVVVYEFDIEEIVNMEVPFRIECSKGTYIRAIARDFGLELDSCAYLTQLRRIKIGEYFVDEAYKIDDINKAFEKHLAV